MAKNANLNAAKEAQENEFYTFYEDIQKELNNYEKHFKGKTVLCNCDDPYESNFCKFFLRNFNYLGLKRLICTSYITSQIIGSQISLFDSDETLVGKGNGYVIDISEVPMANGKGVSDDDINRLLKSKKRGVKKLKGNGDFRSEECIDYLRQSDIVVTNPPFSLLREFINLLVEENKQFLIIGNQNALHYKDVFPLVKENKIWLGYNHVKEFMRPDGSTKKFGNIIWYTNLDVDKRHEEIILYKKYSPEDYPKYENFDAIDVQKVTDIPVDYYGIMGVPDSFLERYNPSQFEIVGLAHGNLGVELGIKPYDRSLRPLNKALRDGDFYYLVNGIPKIPYSRIAIKRREK